MLDGFLISRCNLFRVFKECEGKINSFVLHSTVSCFKNSFFDSRSKENFLRTTASKSNKREEWTQTSSD
jgi:hypothetical protein